VGGAGGVALQVVGPPKVLADMSHDAPVASHGGADQALEGIGADDRVAATQAVGDHTEHPPALPVAATPRVAGPDDALMEASRFAPARMPKVGADGRMARVVYAGPVSPGVAGMPRVALLLSGFGLSERDSRAALIEVPGAVSLAVSAYAEGIAGLLEEARAGGHELLASVPMEPQDYPQNDEGPRSLMTGLAPAENALNLEWALGRTAGAVGATGASDNGMRGQRFAEVAGVFDPMVDEIGRRGLLYIDPRPGRAPVRPGLAARAVDVVLDDRIGRAEIDAKLSALERVARERGSAIGLAGPLRPATIERIGAWARSLGERGMLLVPVSAVVEGQ